MSLRTNRLTRFGFVRLYPADLALVSLVAVLTFYVVTATDVGGTLGLLVALPLVLFLPGYAIVSVLFPARARPARQTTTATTEIESRPRGIDTVERFGLSFALSLAVVPLVMMAIPIAGWGLTTEPIAAALAVLSVALAQLGVVRRLRVPEPDRYVNSIGSTVLGGRHQSGNVVVSVTSLVLVLAVVAAVSVLLFAFASPIAAGGFTELGLYTEDEDGELVAGGFPAESPADEAIPITVGIENHEGEHRNYTVVVQEQVIEDGQVIERTTLREIGASVSDGSMATGEREVTPTASAGETVRISVLLYDDEVPDEPTNENADEDAYFWITMTESESIAEA